MDSLTIKDQDDEVLVLAPWIWSGTTPGPPYIATANFPVVRETDPEVGLTFDDVCRIELWCRQIRQQVEGMS